MRQKELSHRDAERKVSVDLDHEGLTFRWNASTKSPHKGGDASLQLTRQEAEALFWFLYSNKDVIRA